MGISLVRVASIGFLNPAPLMWDFEHAPASVELATRYTLHSTTPAQCAAEISNGTADLGLVPIASYATTPGLVIVRGCAIASLDCVRSIALVVKHPGGLKAVRTVAADTASRSSVVYAQILFRKFFNMDPQFLPHEANLEAMLAQADAALLIGDPALLALQERDESGIGKNYQWFDLAHEWRTHTGLPWVAAFWALRPQALARCNLSATQLTSDLQISRDHGLAHIEELVHEWTPRIALPAATIRDYLTRNIHYTLDDGCIAALNLFFHYAAECKALPPAPELHFI